MRSLGAAAALSLEGLGLAHPWLLKRDVFFVMLLLSLQSSGVELGMETEVTTGRRRGRPVKLVLARLGDAKLELEAALFFSWMARSAREAGIELSIRSGFRTNAEQARLRRCFTTCSCNDCRKAARPGYSSHETGRAIDLDVRSPAARKWLEENAADFGFRRTVPSEPWHYEYFER